MTEVKPATATAVSTTWTPGHPVDLRRTLWPLRRGGLDPTMRVDDDGLWRTCLTPDGPATLLLTVPIRGSVDARAWGSGADWAIDQLPELLGSGDDWTDLDCSAHPLLDRTRRAVPGLRIPRTTLVFESLVPAILEQRVVGADARRSWFQLVTKFGNSAPGPAPDGLRVCPSAGEWSRIPVLGMASGRRRPWSGRNDHCRYPGCRRTPTNGACRTRRPAVTSALRTVPGIGVWTAAETVQRAHGDPDTVSVGDYHLAALVGWALIGEPVDDDGMLELLSQWPGHRHHVVRLIESSGFRKPRFGPRSPRLNHRRH